VKQNQYGHCSSSCPVDNSNSGSGGYGNNNNNNQHHGNQNGCYTVGGPNPGKPCKFPFKWNGKTYSGCPIDTEHKSKRWCSTKVDSYGNHVTHQSQYGYCSNSCPIHNGGGSGGHGGGGQSYCPSGQSCKSIIQCATLAADGDAQSCQLDGDSFGVCCDNTHANLGNFLRNSLEGILYPINVLF